MPTSPVPEPLADLPLAEEHRHANRSAVGHYDAFRTHRERLTALIAAAAPERHAVAASLDAVSPVAASLGAANAAAASSGAVHGAEPNDGGGDAPSKPSLCVLGAGNAFDLDLPRLTQTYGEICLVDIDAAAVAGAIARQAPELRGHLRAVAPVDLSGLLDRLERWARREVTPAELMNHAERTARDVRARVGGAFDVVVSACVSSQMQLDVVRALGDAHPLFRAVGLVLGVAHWRSLAALTKVGGKAVFATDVTAANLYPLTDVADAAQGLALLDAATRAGQVFDFARPSHQRSLLSEDPTLARAFPTWQLADAWLWQNGPATQFLVYAAVLPRA